ncbi:MAG: glycoside hydrolase family 32 protein [Candidatus Hydrogenedentes bacterium]|nr:glycoside hydrolase family 32 protein [Candidatus Hydrogenedentota bacterium]
MNQAKRRIFSKHSSLLGAFLAGSILMASAAEGQGGAGEEAPDNTSRAPKYTFGDTLEEQEAELKTNPLMLRFAESRKSRDGDKYRPTYHFTSPESGHNDPNGLSFWQGRWHLFYQGYPPEDPRQHWGHAVSDDLIHWRDLPYAIYPNPEYACFSGSTLVEEERVIACYHGWKGFGNIVAVSDDPLLLNWEKLTGKPVLPSKNPDGSRPPYGVFDPCIWKKDGMYYQVSTGSVFRSDDLEKWEYLHRFIENDRYSLVGDDYACPYFWPIGDRHILIYFSHMSGGKYLLGDYDKERDKLVVTAGGDFNFGAASPAGVHAPSATPDGEGGIIMNFNMNPGYKQGGQLMSLPRRLTLDANGELRQEPAGDIESLRYGRQSAGATKLPANQEVVIENIHGNAMEIIAEIDSKSAPMVEMNVLRSPDKEEFTRIAFFRERGYRGKSLVTIESSYSSLLPEVLSRAPETAPIAMEEEKPLKLRVFLDKSSIEVFVNGKQCVAMRVYPSREDSVGVSLRSQGQDSVLTRLDAWQMKSIYN